MIYESINYNVGWLCEKICLQETLTLFLNLVNQYKLILQFEASFSNFTVVSLITIVN